MSYRKVYVNVQVVLTLWMDEGQELSEVFDKMDLSFSDQTGHADVEDSEIKDYEIVDSK